MYEERSEGGKRRLQDRRTEREIAVPAEDGSGQQHLLEESTQGETGDFSGREETVAGREVTDGRREGHRRENASELR